MTLAELVALLDQRYPPAAAEPWDAVGLVCGRQDTPVSRVLFAVDPVPAVVAEAVSIGAQLIVTHHPLFLQPVSEVSATQWKGEIVHELIEHGIGLLCAHTNADVVPGGVNDALAAALGLRDTTVLVPSDSGDSLSGLGRVGRLETPESLTRFVDRVARSLPATRAGLRVAGEPDRVVERVAACGGAGGSLLDAVHAAHVDVYVTADLRHHQTVEAGLAGGPALVDPGHWASEWPWLPMAAQQLADDATRAGATVDVAVSSVVTDPWSGHRPSET